MYSKPFSFSLCFAICLTISAVQAESVPKLINFQGRLAMAELDGQGNPKAPPDGNYAIEFRIFDAPTGGALVWGSSYESVPVHGGQFNVVLGSGGSPLAGENPAVNDIGFAFSEADRYVEIDFESAPDAPVKLPKQTLTPRQQILSAPFALQAQNASHAQKAGEAEIAASAEQLIEKYQQALNLTGMIITYAGEVGTDAGGLIEPVPGYLLCNGAVIDLAMEDGKYADLVSVLGSAWGHGGASNDPQVVNLPDLRGVFVRGWNGGASDGYADPNRSNSNRPARRSGGNVGNRVGSFQMDELREHSHPYVDRYRAVTSTFGGGTSLPVLNLSNNLTESQRTTTSTGSSETRGKNAYVVYLIKY
jgi:microcystin-dependent protein